MNSAVSKQGKLFKKYQNKIINNTTNISNNISNNSIDQGRREPKEKKELKELKGIKENEGNNKNNKNNKNTWDWGFNFFKEGFDNEDVNSQFVDIKVLQDNLEKLLAEYESSQNSLINKTQQYTTVTANNKYANKNIQFTTGHICYVTNQGIVKWIPSNDIWDSISGKNGCPLKDYINVDLPWLPEYNNAGTIIPTNPPLLSGTPMTQAESCGNAGKNVYVNELLKDTSEKYIGCFRDKPETSLINENNNLINDDRAMTMTNSGDYIDFETCKQRAIDGGWKYFGIQDLNSEGNAQCSVSNDGDNLQKYGEANNTTWIPLWSSGTNGKTVSGVSLMSDGRLVITESDTGIELWTSSNNPSECIFSGYVNPDSIQGSFGGNCIGKPKGIDCGKPENTSYESEGLAGNLNDPLKEYATSAFQQKLANFSLPSQVLWMNKPDPAVCCAKTVDYSYQCGGGPFKTGSLGLGGAMIFNCSKEVENCKKFTLELQDDGNMCIYQGINSPALWCTGTNGKAVDNNPNWVATNGKYGVPRLTTGQVLGPNEWISSTDGLIILLMQTDGNLVLYSSKTNLNCTKKNDKSYGGSWANAVYELNDQGIPGNIGKLGFVDSNGLLSEYPQDMIVKTNNYRMLPNNDSAGNDFGGMPLNNSNIDQCKEACTTTENCSGFVFDRSNNNCWLKNENVYPVGERQVNANLDLYLREPTIKNDPSCSNIIQPIDSVSWERYRKSRRKMTKDSTCGLAKVAKPSIEVTNDLKTQIAEIAKQIVDKINNLGSSNMQLNSEMQQMKSELVGNIDTYQKINKEYSKNKKDYSENINGILTDTDQIVLNENYNYMFWSILAIGIIVIIMNLKKK
jgi:hypothetical protein